MTTSGLQGYLASHHQALGVFHHAALEEKLEGEALAMIQDVTNQNGAEVCRKLCRRYHGKTFGTKLVAMRKVVALE